MTRRTALKALAAGMAAFVLPAPRRTIDLTAFCDWRKATRRYDMAMPYELEDWTYATDSKVCVRVRPEMADAVHHVGKMPPFESLNWNHDTLRGWQPMPSRSPLLEHDGMCPACEGYGFEGGVCGNECETCEGTGVDGRAVSRSWRCEPCDGSGFVAPPGVAKCPACKGNAMGDFPSVVELEGRYFDVALYERVRSLGAEFAFDWLTPAEFRPLTSEVLKFKFSGGEGLLMPREGRYVRLKRGVTA